MPDEPDQASSGADDLQELRTLADRLSMDRTVTWEEPPPGLWERIAAEVQRGDATAVAASGAPETLEAPEGPASPEVDTPPIPITRARGRARRFGALPWVVGAAAAVVLVVAGLAVLVNRQTDPTVVASAELDRLGVAGSGRAELVDQDGQLVLRVDTADLDPGDGFLEVWVIDPDVTKLVSLGPLRPDGTYDLPPGLDPTLFPIVDVSVEPLDGNPTHSGDSVLRGELQF
jgi:hypothetical protein